MPQALQDTGRAPEDIGIGPAKGRARVAYAATPVGRQAVVFFAFILLMVLGSVYVLEQRQDQIAGDVIMDIIPASGGGSAVGTIDVPQGGDLQPVVMPDAPVLTVPSK